MGAQCIAVFVEANVLYNLRFQNSSIMKLHTSHMESALNMTTNSTFFTSKVRKAIKISCTKQHQLTKQSLSPVAYIIMQ